MPQYRIPCWIGALPVDPDGLPVPLSSQLARYPGYLNDGGLVQRVDPPVPGTYVMDGEEQMIATVDDDVIPPDGWQALG